MFEPWFGDGLWVVGLSILSFSSGIFRMGARGYQLTRLVQYLLLLERRRMDTTPDRVEIYQRQKKKGWKGRGTQEDVDTLLLRELTVSAGFFQAVHTFC